MTTSSTPPSAHGSGLDAAGFPQSWFPVGLAQDLGNGAVTGIDFLGTRVIMYRDPAGKPVVQSAWCPHLGADLSIGLLVDGQIRCAYHHWRFDPAGDCVHIPTGDKIPPGARIFTYPTAEAWGIVWAFNGEMPLFEPPAIPDVAEHDLIFEARLRGVRNVANWVALSNGVDFQHLRTLHNLPVAATPETIDVRDYAIEYRVEAPIFLQHGRITGTSAFGLHLRRAEEDSFMLFAGAPIDEKRTRSFYVVGVRRSPKEVDPGATTVARLPALRDFVEKLMAEDEPVLNSMRFRKGTLVASDRHLARYFKYIGEFPRAPARLDDEL